MTRPDKIPCAVLVGIFLTTCDHQQQDIPQQQDSEQKGVYCVSGDAIPFNTNDRMADATISVLEFPDLSRVTGDDGHFEFCGFHAGDEVSLRLEAEGQHPIQTATFTIDDTDIDRITFQVVNNSVYNAMASIVEVTPDEENLCQMVTTVTRVGKSLYDWGAHGESGATVTIEPALDAEQGPIYFGENVLPDRTLIETSDDGGVLFVQAEPGDYVLTATKPGVKFTQVKMKCRAGWLINASPPRGLQALE